MPHGQVGVEGMTKRRFDTDRVMNSATLQPQNSARFDAVSVGMSTAVLVFCGVIGAWIVARYLWDVPVYTVLLSIPAAVLSGAAVGALKLLDFVNEHRRYLYPIETITGIDIDRDGVVGVPPEDEVTMLRGIDMQFHRINTQLTDDDKRALKAYLLLDGKATVRGLSAIVGERASMLRSELIGLGICQQPQHGNAAAVLSREGLEAVKRW